MCDPLCQKHPSRFAQQDVDCLNRRIAYPAGHPHAASLSAAGHVHEGLGDDGIATAWKAQTFEEMMQSVTAAEQRMLDISSMRVA